MANKEKDGKIIAPSEKELNGESVKTQLQERVDYHNKLVAEKERIIGELKKVETALNQSLGGINTLQDLQNEYFVQDVPSVNGEA
jgi:hypothetical protein